MPPRVKVQVYLVDQNNRALGKRIGAVRKSLEEPPGKIHGQGEHRLIPQAEVRERRHGGVIRAGRSPYIQRMPVFGINDVSGK